MGTGKTTVGRLLAEQTQMPLVDMDAEIEAQAGKSISEIFAQEGEPHFRQLERAMTQKLASRSGQIISTGGGIVLNPKNVFDYAQSGLVVCLQADTETILKRLQHDTSRPLLEGDKQKNIRQLFETRKALYAAIPYQIDTSGQTPAQIAAQIIEQYQTNNP